jgi:hypothetical protein
MHLIRFSTALVESEVGQHCSFLIRFSLAPTELAILPGKLPENRFHVETHHAPSC